MRTKSRDGDRIWYHANTSEDVVRAVASWTRLSLRDQDDVRSAPRIFMSVDRTISFHIFSWRPYFIERCEHYASLLFPADPALSVDQPWRRA
jgi:hypothetical protein